MTLYVSARSGWDKLVLLSLIIMLYRSTEHYTYRYAKNIIMRNVRAHNVDIYIYCIVIAAIVRHHNRGDCCTRAQRGNSRNRAPRAIMF